MATTTEPNLPFLVSGGAFVTAKALQCIHRGKREYFAHSLNAYGRTGEPCPRCCTVIKRITDRTSARGVSENARPAPRVLPFPRLPTDNGLEARFRRFSVPTVLEGAGVLDHSAVIDFHQHFIPDFYRDAAVAAGHVNPDGMPGFPDWSVDEALGMMERNGITVAVVSVSSPGVHFGDDAAARRLAREVNEHIAGVRDEHPDRFAFLASLPLPDTAGALAEIEYVYDTLPADGVVMETNAGGLYLGDPAMGEVLDALDRRRVLAYRILAPRRSRVLYMGAPELAAPPRTILKEREMNVYRNIVRGLFAAIFVAGGIAHLVLGRVAPEGYAVFGDTALLPWLSALWDSFVMPNIYWLTIALGIFEIAVGLGILLRRTARLAAWGMVAFLVFITILGYGFPTGSFWEDFLKNRIVTIVMAGALVPLLFGGDSRRDPKRRVGAS